MFQNCLGIWDIDVGLLDKSNSIKSIGRKKSDRSPMSNCSTVSVPPKVFGYTCFVRIPKKQWDKLDPKAIKCIFVGYPSYQKGFKCYLPRKNGTVILALDVKFHDDVPYYSPKSKEFIHEENQGSLCLLSNQYLPCLITDK